MAVTVDEMLEQIGSFGRFQWILLSICGYATIVATAFPTMMVPFITAEPDWICVKGYNNSACNFTESITLTSENYNARCSMPREAWTYVKGITSAVTEYDLVCDKSYQLVIAQSCYWVGIFVAYLLGGFAADRFGRKLVFYCGSVCLLLATWVMVFPKHFSVFIVGRTFSGFGAGMKFAVDFVLLTEFTGKMYRAKLGVTSFYFWTIGVGILTLIAYFLTNWRHLLLAISVASTPLLVMWWFLPESPRWLLLHGKPNKAREQLINVARINKKPFPNDELKIPEFEEKGSFRHLFFNLELTKRSLISWNIWISIGIVYFGVSYGSVDIGWNRYLTFGLTSIVELPSYYAAIFALDRYGRKKSTTCGLVIASLALIVAVSIPYEQSRKVSTSIIFRIIMAMIAKFSINFSFCTHFVWTVELYPTSIRAIAVGTSQAAMSLGSIAGSYLIWLIRIHPVLPSGIMGLMCVEAAILSLFLPETIGQSTIETMAEMNRKQNNVIVASSQEDPVCNDNKLALGKMYLDQQM